jgi:hypothetical protein
MPGNSMECRRHALRCAELGMAARTPQLKAMFLELSKNWKTLDLSLLQTIELNVGYAPPLALRTAQRI